MLPASNLGTTHAVKTPYDFAPPRIFRESAENRTGGQVRSPDCCGIRVCLPATVFDRPATAADVQKTRIYLAEIPTDSLEITADIKEISTYTTETTADITKIAAYKTEIAANIAKIAFD